MQRQLDPPNAEVTPERADTQTGPRERPGGQDENALATAPPPSLRGLNGGPRGRKNGPEQCGGTLLDGPLTFHYPSRNRPNPLFEKFLPAGSHPLLRPLRGSAEPRTTRVLSVSLLVFPRFLQFPASATRSKPLLCDARYRQRHRPDGRARDGPGPPR